MNSQILILSLTAASVGFIHTLFGPDHYLPFIVLSKARKWSNVKTAWITVLCGIGHISGSVLIGFIGIAFGIALSKLQHLESIRGNITGWVIILFGLGYTLWGLKRAFKNQKHTHAHFHLNGMAHTHEHTHFEEHAHPHVDQPHSSDDGVLYSEKVAYKKLTPWLLFIIFVLGPCEPLIPLVMFPASQHNTSGVICVISVFGVITIVTMTTLVMLMTCGMKFVKFQKLEKYTHALAGATIFFCGIAIQFLGL